MVLRVSPRRDGETDRDLAARLGIQVCHILANVLVDISELGDRDLYKRALRDIESEHGPVMRKMAADHAARQIRAATRMHRHFGWRVAWITRYPRTSRLPPGVSRAV